MHVIRQRKHTRLYVAVLKTASPALRGPPFADLPLYITRLQSWKVTADLRCMTREAGCAAD